MQDVWMGNSPERKRKRGPDRKPRKVAAASVANLEKGKDFQFQPGQSGNPGGLPGTDLATQHARRFFEESGSIEGFAAKLPKGFNAHAFNVLRESAYGKAKQQVELMGEGGGPIAVTVRFIKGTLGEMK